MSNIVPFSSSVGEKANAKVDILPALLSVDEVCEYLGLGKTTVYEMTRTGELPSMKIRNRIRIASTDLKEYLNEKKVK